MLSGRGPPDCADPVQILALLTGMEERPWPCHIGRVANGQVVLVTTERLEGGPPTRVVYYVAEEDPARAEAVIGAIMAPNEKVEALGQLPEAAVRALGLKPGEFRSFHG